MSSLARKAPAGSDGLLLLPYLEGERTPNVPDGTGVYLVSALKHLPKNILPEPLWKA